MKEPGFCDQFPDKNEMLNELYNLPYMLRLCSVKNARDLLGIGRKRK